MKKNRISKNKNRIENKEISRSRRLKEVVLR